MENRIRMFLELYQLLALQDYSTIHLIIGTCRSYTDAAQLTVRIGNNIVATATLVDDYSQYPGGPTYGPIIGKASHVEIIADEMGIRYNRCEAHSDTSCSQDWYNRAMELSIHDALKAAAVLYRKPTLRK